MNNHLLTSSEGLTVSDPSNTPSGPSDHTLALVGALLGLAVIIVAGIIAVAIAVPSSQNPTTIIVILLGAFSTLIPQLVTAIIGGRSAQKLDRVLNGEMDRKIQNNVHQVLDVREAAAETPQAPPAPPRHHEPR